MTLTLSRRAVLVGATATALTLGLATPLAAQDVAPLRIVTSFAIDSMNPWVDGFWMQEFGQAELLMQFRADGGHHPWLLSALDSPEPNRWVMTLREGLTFQNGRPVDAAAVLAAIEAAIARSDSAKSAVPEGASFAVTGPLELTVTTTAPWPELPGVLADESVFLILDAKAVAEAGEDWSKLVGAGIYTGPYAVTALDSARMEATAYPGYWQGKPALPGLTVAFVPDANARILAVQNDEADIALYPPLAARPAVDASGTAHFNVGSLSTGGFTGFMNLRQAGPIRDPNVRKAILRAVDYREIAEDVFRGGLAQATSLYAANLPFALANYRTDLAEAAALLDAAGWVPGADGVRVKDGARLTLVLAIYPQQPDLVPLSTAVQAQLARVGIAVEIVSFDGITAALSEPSNRWDIALVSSGAAGYGRVQNFLTTFFPPDGRRNYGYDNPEVTEAIARLATEPDPTRRTAILHRIQTILWEDDPYAFSLNIHLGRVVVNDRYACYQPGFALYHVSWQTAPCG